MSAELTIILPHKRNPGNDRALKVALECLFDNTDHDFTLIVDACDNEPIYPRVNRMFAQARTDACVFFNSDMFAAPHWDTPMLELLTDDRIVTNVVVEPRAISMHGENHEKDFGRTPETFDRAGFEAWCVGGGHVPTGIGWGTPYMMDRWMFRHIGGLRTDLPSDDPEFTGADVFLFNKWKASEREIVRAKSFVYHLQRYSDIDEQEHEKRR